MPFLTHTALTRAPPSPPVAVIAVPSSSGIWVAWTVSGIAYCLTRQDAARMQHLGAAARDLLCFVVVERTQQARARHRVRIRGEHARHVGPDLEAAGAELGGEVAARGVRAAAPEQHGVALRVARDESLGQVDRSVARQSPLQLGIGLEVAGRRQKVRALGGVRPLLGAQQTCVRPATRRRAPASARYAAPETRRHQLAGGHHPRAQPVADLADQLDARTRCDAARRSVCSSSGTARRCPRSRARSDDAPRSAP